MKQGRMTVVEQKEASPAVAEAVCRLLAQLTSRPCPFGMPELEQMLRSGNCRLFMARVDNEAVGMLTVGQYATPTGRKCWLEDVVMRWIFVLYQGERAFYAGSVLFWNSLQPLRRRKLRMKTAMSYTKPSHRNHCNSACCKAAFFRAAALQKRNRPRGMFNTASPDFSFAPCRPKKFSFSRTAF